MDSFFLHSKNGRSSFVLTSFTVETGHKNWICQTCVVFFLGCKNDEKTTKKVSGITWTYIFNIGLQLKKGLHPSDGATVMSRDISSFFSCQFVCVYGWKYFFQKNISVLLFHAIFIETQCKAVYYGCSPLSPARMWNLFLRYSLSLPKNDRKEKEEKVKDCENK